MWGELLATGAMRWAFAPPIGLRLEGAAGFPVERQDFTIIPFGVVHTIPAVTARVGIGLDVRF
jgi:hypothetical protein